MRLQAGGAAMNYVGVAVGVGIMCLVAMNQKDRDE